MIIFIIYNNSKSPTFENIKLVEVRGRINPGQQGANGRGGSRYHTDELGEKLGWVWVRTQSRAHGNRVTGRARRARLPHAWGPRTCIADRGRQRNATAPFLSPIFLFLFFLLISPLSFSFFVRPIKEGCSGEKILFVLLIIRRRRRCLIPDNAILKQ